MHHILLSSMKVALDQSTVLVHQNFLLSKLKFIQIGQFSKLVCCHHLITLFLLLPDWLAGLTSFLMLLSCRRALCVRPDNVLFTHLLKVSLKNCITFVLLVSLNSDFFHFSTSPQNKNLGLKNLSSAMHAVWSSYEWELSKTHFNTGYLAKGLFSIDKMPWYTYIHTYKHMYMKKPKWKCKII